MLFAEHLGEPVWILLKYIEYIFTF